MVLFTGLLYSHWSNGIAERRLEGEYRSSAGLGSNVLLMCCVAATSSASEELFMRLGSRYQTGERRGSRLKPRVSYRSIRGAQRQTEWEPAGMLGGSSWTETTVSSVLSICLVGMRIFSAHSWRIRHVNPLFPNSHVIFHQFNPNPLYQLCVCVCVCVCVYWHVCVIPGAPWVSLLNWR